MTRRRAAAVLAAALTLAAGCGGDGPTSVGSTTVGPDVGSSTSEQRFPDVIGAEATLDQDGTWAIAVTLSSPYDAPDRYADAWRVLGPDGDEYAVRVLTHDHAAEQPFTRRRSGIEIPVDVDVVTIEGRDLVHGWGGATFELTLPGR